MKTIATVAVLMMLTANAWADQPENKQANDPMNTSEPILLSEAEMDRVSAGRVGGKMHLEDISLGIISRASTSTFVGYSFDVK